VVDPVTSTLHGVEVTENRATTHWTDPTMAALQKKLAAMVQGAQVEISSFTVDRSVVIVKVGDASAPGAYFIYRAADQSLQPLAINNQTLKLRRLHPVKTIRYKARDGLEIAAVLTLPRGNAGKNLPLILMPHGGPAARDEEAWDWWSQFLADRGYAVIQPNYRGSTGYGTPFTRKGEGQWGLAMQDDLNDGVKALVEQGIADPKRVCVVGGSYGGYAALRAAQRDGALFRCAVSFAGVSDLQRLLAFDSNALGHEASADWLKAQAPDFKAISPLFHPEDFSIPVLIVHGKKDRRVPFKQSKLMADRLAAAGKTFQFIEQPEGDHFFTRQEDRLSFLKALEAFLTKYNPA
jgi:dipeptidyl aminopeptidase/acylaminoacyl peptidase